MFALDFLQSLLILLQGVFGLKYTKDRNSYSAKILLKRFCIIVASCFILQVVYMMIMTGSITNAATRMVEEAQMNSQGGASSDSSYSPFHGMTISHRSGYSQTFE